jgi:hypothetical protein
MGKVAIGFLVAVLAVLVAVQLILPRVIAGQVEKRLEQDGGTAAASVSAFPAVTLLAGRGGSIEIAGHDLRYELGQRKERPFERLDGFEHVRIDLEDLDTGPVRLTSFRLRRDGRDQPYTLALRGSTTPRDLANELGSATGGTLGGVLGGLASGFLPQGGATSVPLRLDADVSSRDGKPEVGTARASVAGLPAGPLTEVVLRSVLQRL